MVASQLREFMGVFRLRSMQLLALACLLAGLAGLGIGAGTSIQDPDIWWHIKVGDWIVQNHSVPHVGIFSRTAGSQPWVAYSWACEVLQSRAYAWFGLVGFALYGVLLTLAVAWTLFWMAQRLSGRFWVSWALCGIGSLGFLFTLMPRPVFFSMILFMVELTLILEAQRSSRIRSLYWLPVLFVLWANLHIQFIYGLLVLGLFVGVNLLFKIARALGFSNDSVVVPALPLQPLFAVFAACALAACLGPYTYHLYEVVLKYSQSKAAYGLIQELLAPDYKSFTDYVMVLLTAGSFFAIGARKKLDLFKLSLLLVATVLAFRTARDGWFVGVCAVAILADHDERQAPNEGIKLAEFAGLSAIVAALLFLIASNLGFSGRDLDRTISRTYPVDAANFLRRNPAPGPLYNSLDWGGFLIWYMPQYPVSIDGRNDLYGDAFDVVAFKSLQGDYADDPYLNEAGVVLLPKSTPLATMLSVDAKFEVIYQDQLAVVLVRK